MRSAFALLVVLVSSLMPSVGWAQTVAPDAGVVANAAQVTVAMPPGVRSVRVVNEGELVRVTPTPNGARRGLLGRGARLAVLEAATAPGCSGPWVRVAVDGWVCSDRLAVTNEAPEAATLPLLREGALPFRYAITAHPRTRLWTRRSEVGDVAHASETDRGYTVAVLDTLLVGRERYAETADHRFIALRDLVWMTTATGSGSGIMYPASVTAPSGVGFVVRGARAWSTAQSAVSGVASGPTHELAPRRAVMIRDERVVRGVRVVQTEHGWVQAGYVVRPEVGALPAGVGAHERWVDVDRARQVMVAMEGAVPRWAALVSTGREGHLTHAGEFRVRVKVATDDMSNVGEAASTGEPAYFVARVPWVMYFHGGEAFHAAFWHDGFGAPRSHGCVNLHPGDARWLYGWAPPQVPPGWSAVSATASDPGMRVRVR